MVMITSLFFYSLFAATGFAIDLASVQVQIRQITGTCDNAIPRLQQTLADSKAYLGAASAVGASAADLAPLNASYTSATSALATFELSCSCLHHLMDQCATLFTPAAVAVFGLLLAYFASTGMCVATKCCGNPQPDEGKVVPEGEMGELGPASP